MKISKKTVKLALTYASLQPESGYPDMNAAITLARALLRTLRIPNKVNKVPR